MASSSDKVSQPVRPSLTLLVSRIILLTAQWLRKQLLNRSFSTSVSQKVKKSVSQAVSQLINRLRMYLSQFLSFLTLHCSVAVILYQISLVTNNHDSCAVIRSFLKHVYTCKKLVTINLLCGLAYLWFPRDSVSSELDHEIRGKWDSHPTGIHIFFPIFVTNVQHLSSQVNPLTPRNDLNPLTQERD